MSNVTLTPMTEAEYQVYLPRSVKDYAEDNVRAGYSTPEEALAKSQETFDKLLPQGVNTPENHLYTIREAETGQSLGIIWIHVQAQRKPPSAFIYDIAIDEAQRGKGYGTATMLAIEDEARKLGVSRIALHVFGHNQTALSLYQKVGYAISSYNMSKDI